MSTQPKIRFRCRKCGKGMSISPEYAGKKGKCKCGAVVRIPMVSEFEKIPKSYSPKVIESTTDTPLQKETKEEKTNVPHFCINCGNPYVIPARHIGKQLKCPGCGASIAMPAAASNKSSGTKQSPRKDLLQTTRTHEGIESLQFLVETRPFAGRRKKYSVQLDDKQMTITSGEMSWSLVVPRDQAKKRIKLSYFGGGHFGIDGDKKRTFYAQTKQPMTIKAISDWISGKKPSLEKPTLRGLIKKTHPALRDAAIAVYIEICVFFAACMMMSIGAGLSGSFEMVLIATVVGMIGVGLYSLALVGLQKGYVWVCGIFVIFYLLTIIFGVGADVPADGATQRIVMLIIKWLRLTLSGVLAFVHIYSAIQYVRRDRQSELQEIYEPTN